MSFQSPLTVEDEAKKLQFAAEWVRNIDVPVEAALKIFPSPYDLGKRNYVATFWPYDKEVIAEKERLLATHGEESYLPDRVALAKELWKIITDPFTAKRDKVAASKEYRELMGYVNLPMGGSAQQEELPREPTYKVVTA